MYPGLSGIPLQPPPAADPKPAPKMKKKVLIVDDEVMFTNAIKLAFGRKKDYEICVENDPSMAVAAARKFEPNVIILDVIMPEMDGGEVHSQLMADPKLRHIPIIFLTAIVRQKEVEEHNGVIGGSFFIAKPVDADGLCNAIEKFVRL